MTLGNQPGLLWSWEGQGQFPAYSSLLLHGHILSYVILQVCRMTSLISSGQSIGVSWSQEGTRTISSLFLFASTWSHFYIECNCVGLQTDKFDQFWAINRRFMEPGGGEDYFKLIKICFHMVTFLSYAIVQVCRTTSLISSGQSTGVSWSQEGVRTISNTFLFASTW